MRLAVRLGELAQVADPAETGDGNPNRPRDAERAELGVGVETHARGKNLGVDAAAGEVGAQLPPQRDAPRLPEHRAAPAPRPAQGDAEAAGGALHRRRRAVHADRQLARPEARVLAQVADVGRGPHW